jgi:DNA replication protein DnaC
MKRCEVCGDLVVRQRMQAMYRKKAKRIAAYTHLQGRAENQTFATFDLRNDEEGTAPVRLALAKARAFAADPSDFLVLTGSRGVGKSHLAAAIANALLNSDEAFPPLPLMFVIPDLLEMLRSGFDEGDYHRLLDLCKRVDVLILDDLGTESRTDWAFEKMFQIINYRYNTRLPTVVVTNCRLQELEPRLHSRLADDQNTVVAVNAPDYRQRKSSPGLVL